MDGFNLIEPSVEEFPKLTPPATVTLLNSVFCPNLLFVAEKAAKTNWIVTTIKIIIIPAEISRRIFFIIIQNNTILLHRFSQEVFLLTHLHFLTFRLF